MSRRSDEPSVVLLIRHAEAIWTNKRLPGRVEGIDLSKRGYNQAEALAKELSCLPIRAVRSSPLERAVQTAEPLARALGVPIVEELDLIEADAGEWAGRTFREVVRLRSYKELAKNPILRRPPGGETILEVQARVVRFVERVSKEQPGTIVAAVSHADPIKAAVAGLLGLPVELYRRLEIGVGSVSAFVLSDGPLLLCSNADGRRAVSAYASYVSIRRMRKPPG